MKLVHVTEAHSCTNMAGKKFGLLVVSKVEWEVFTLGKKKKKKHSCGNESMETASPWWRLSSLRRPQFSSSKQAIAVRSTVV